MEKPKVRTVRLLDRGKRADPAGPRTTKSRASQKRVSSIGKLGQEIEHAKRASSSAIDLTCEFQLSPQTVRELASHFGGPLDEWLIATIQNILYANKQRRATVKATTPAQIVKRLKHLDAAIGTFLGEPCDLESLSRLFPPLSQARIVIAGRIQQLGKVGKLPGVAPRLLGVTAGALGAIFRTYSPIARNEGGRVTAGRPWPLARSGASSTTVKACRNFVCTALRAANVTHDDPKKNPRRIDDLIWSDNLSK